MERKRIFIILIFLIASTELSAQYLKLETNKKPFLRSVQIELPNQENNAIKTSWPSIGAWFWMKEDLEPGGYKNFIDLYEKYTPIGLLATSLRCPGELTDPVIHDQIKKASAYARKKSIGIVMDLDVRHAREKFKEKYPNELQQVLLLRECKLKGSDTVMMKIKSPEYEDHYTFGRTGYVPVNSKLVRVYSYRKENGLIKSGSVRDITNRCQSFGNKNELQLTVSCKDEDEGRTACALVAVTIFTPDVFAPHLLSYQRGILSQYADASLAGACKDEWGFPGRFSPKTNDLWYSVFMADEYAKKQPGHELLRDMLLMSIGEQGQEAERDAAINNYMEMYWKRNGEIETDFYHAVKKLLGKDAMVATHPTWYPYPDVREIFKNGLDWWNVKRDLAQTDESTPYCVRTALAKKMQSPLWYNMYYNKSIKEYYKELWISVLGGGRINYHPLWPHPVDKLTTSLLGDTLMKAECRIHLLNYISSAAIDCRVAVIFGHPSALNWSDGKGFADVGMDVTNALWKEGFYADLIPSSEIINGSLKINSKGKIQYGSQQYDAVVFYHPEYSRKEIADLFVSAGKKGGTALYRIGNWTRDFYGNKFNGDAAMPLEMKNYDSGMLCAREIINQLKMKGVPSQTRCEMRGTSGFPASMMPGLSGQVRLIDGTVIIASGKNNVMGDSIRKSIVVEGRKVSFDAIGIAAVRLNKHGYIEAIAGGGLKSFKTETFSIDLPERMDIALFKEHGKWRGIVQGYKGKLPATLTKITKDWTRIKIPEQYREPNSD
ncbi:MAG: hypothetical protein ABI237_19375 [Ginsengibacter sp.]